MIEIAKSQKLSHFSLVLGFRPLVKDVQSGSGVTWNGVELLRNGRNLTTK